MTNERYELFDDETSLGNSLEAEAGWLATDPLFQVGSIRSFISGDPFGKRIRVRYFKRERDGALVGKVWFGPGAEGPRAMPMVAAWQLYSTRP